MESVSGETPPMSLLLAEDDDASREALVAILTRRFPHVAVFWVDNGRTGLEMFQRQTPDIVITDISMPEMGGIEMADKIRAIKPDTKLIVLTADTGKDALEHAIGTGFQVHHYILKPVHLAELFAVIEQCVAELALGK